MKYEEFAENIISFLRHSKVPVQLNEIAKHFGIKSDTNEYDDLKLIIKDLSNQNIIIKQSRRRYALNDFTQPATISGKLRIKNDRGLVETDNTKIGIVQIKRRDLATALDGDTVKIKLLPTKKESRYRAEVIEIIERDNSPITGTIEKDGEFYFLIPDDTRHYIDFLIPKNKLGQALHGDKVKAKFLRWNDPLKSPQAEIIKVLGISGDPAAEFDSFVNELNLNQSFPKSVIDETNKINKKISPSEIQLRLDLRDKDIITIDPEDAKDFDDALSLEELPNGNLLLGVHIADVSHYVKENSHLDLEAYKRATSIYLADRVIPMLPELLSNDICSLKPKEDRLTFSILMELSNRGVLKDYQIRPSIINSKRRFSYPDVLDIIRTGQGEFSELILKLHNIAETLRTKRFKKGGIDFETYEIRFQLDESKNPIKANLKVPDESTSLVEECMLAANQVAAAHIKKLARKHRKRELPYLFRVHDDPDPKQIKNAIQFIRTLMPVGKIKDLSSKGINTIITQFTNKNEKYIVNSIMIRSMAKAIYSPDNIGHFGLGFSEYTHFTSPIRRYPDLIVHRLIKEYSNGINDDSRFKFLRAWVKDAAKHSSEAERFAVETERESAKLASVLLCKPLIGRIYTGTVSGVTSFGLFVLLDEVFAEGMIHIRDVNDDYYYLDEKRFCLIGRNKGKIFRIGKKVKVRIIRSDIEKRRLDLAYIPEE
jgi:ribonuclease R